MTSLLKATTVQQNSQSSEQGTYQPVITPNYTIGIGKPKRTSHQTMIELKKRAQKQTNQVKLRKEKAILKKLDTIFFDSEEEPKTMNNPGIDNRPDNDQQERKDIEEKGNNETKENTSGRGERTRCKPDSYGHSIMVSKLSPSFTQEKEH